MVYLAFIAVLLLLLYVGSHKSKLDTKTYLIGGGVAIVGCTVVFWAILSLLNTVFGGGV